MIPVHNLIALLAAQADEGDEDAAIQLNALVASYPAHAVQAAQMYRPTQRPLVLANALVLASAEAPAVENERSLGDILAECFNLAPQEEDAATPWELLDWLTDTTATHYGLHRDDAYAAQLDLEIEYAELHGTYNFGTLPESPWGLALIASAVAERVMGETPTNPQLHLTIH